jgi:hypothetical protein
MWKFDAVVATSLFYACSWWGSLLGVWPLLIFNGYYYELKFLCFPIFEWDPSFRLKLKLVDEDYIAHINPSEFADKQWAWQVQSFECNALNLIIK